MIQVFEFEDEDIEDMCALAYQKPPLEPFADEDQILSFVGKIEDTINHYPLFVDLPDGPESQRKLKAASETVQKLYERLLNPGDTLGYLHDSLGRLNIDGLLPPDPAKVQELLISLGVQIEFKRKLLKGKRTSTVANKLHRFASTLVCQYFFEFGKWPANSGRKMPKPGREHPLQSPFTHFLDHALQALVREGHVDQKDVPRDTRHLIRKSVNTFQHLFAWELTKHSAADRPQGN